MSGWQIFTVRHEQDFQIVASPAELVTASGSEASLMVQLASTGAKPFTGVAQLSVVGLPGGVAANLSSPALGAGRTASLSLTVPAALAAGTYMLRHASKVSPRSTAATSPAAPPSSSR